MGKSTINGPFSIAMLVYQRVISPAQKSDASLNIPAFTLPFGGFLHDFSCPVTDRQREQVSRIGVFIIVYILCPAQVSRIGVFILVYSLSMFIRLCHLSRKNHIESQIHEKSSIKVDIILQRSHEFSLVNTTSTVLCCTEE